MEGAAARNGDLRAGVLAAVAADICGLPEKTRRRIAVDGVDGAGKSVFGDELASVLTRQGLSVVRASVDGFHNPRALRHRRGRDSPEGFFRDSYDYASLVSLLLEPLSPGGTGEFVRRVHDVAAERPVRRVVERAGPDAILIVDGIFLHRPELIAFWDYSIWLDVPFEVSVARAAERDGADPDPAAASNRRYVEGQRLYLRECDPMRHASVVIDNTQLDRPSLRRPSDGARGTAGPAQRPKAGG